MTKNEDDKTNKVWIVFSRFLSGQDVISGVFSSFSAAEEACLKAIEESEMISPSYYVEEWEVK